MRQIGSSDGHYLVFIRDMAKPLRLSQEGGERLSNYLTSDNINQFVQITDTDKQVRVVRTSTIERVEKYSSVSTSYKTADELKLPDLSLGERFWR